MASWIPRSSRRRRSLTTPSMRWGVVGCALFVGTALPSCGPDGDSEASNAGTPANDAGGDGSSDKDAPDDSTVWTEGGQSDGGGPDACAAQSEQATLEKMPVDIIMYVDTSSTMGPASASVEQNINTNLAQVLTSANVDFRLIALAGYGSGDQLCVDPPLGGALCTPDPPALPANTNQFFHYTSAGGSGALFDNILAWYTAPDTLGTAPDGWKTWVRPEALKAFLIFSDTSSGPTMAGETFDQQLLALDPLQFGTSDARKYVLHAIIGLRENDPPTAAWMPTDPVVTDTCSAGGYAGAVAPGEECQKVAILTGGLRFPLCEFASFDVVFQALAEDVVALAPVACSFPFPTPPSGQTLDPNTIELDYTPGDGSAVQAFTQVASPAECDAASFYVDQETIILCPEACDVVQSDPGASIGVRFGCDVGFAK